MRNQLHADHKIENRLKADGKKFLKTLRPDQVEDLGFHLANPESLNLSDPATGKTPTVCVLAYYHWARLGKRTVWSMPKSLLEKEQGRVPRLHRLRPRRRPDHRERVSAPDQGLDRADHGA